MGTEKSELENQLRRVKEAVEWLCIAADRLQSMAHEVKEKLEQIKGGMNRQSGEVP